MNRGKRIAALISLLVLGCVLVFVAFMLLQVREIHITGCSTLEEKQVEELSGIEYGECIFFVDTETVMEALAANPAIKPVSVKIVYPYSVDIEIAERTPAAYIDTDGMRLTLDSEGVLLSVDMAPQGEALPQVVGFSTARFEVGQPLGEDAYKRSVFSSLLQALGNYELGVACIDITYASSIKLMTPDGFTIELGNEDDLAAKLKLALQMKEKVIALGKTGGIIDAATGKTAYFRES